MRAAAWRADFRGVIRRLAQRAVLPWYQFAQPGFPAGNRFGTNPALTRWWFFTEGAQVEKHHLGEFQNLKSDRPTTERPFRSEGGGCLWSVFEVAPFCPWVCSRAAL